MNHSAFKINTNRKIARDTYEMILQAKDPVSGIRPGQFINIKIHGSYLRRPISICDWDREEKTITIIYKVVGKGTDRMSRMKEGSALDILWPLGNGYDLSELEIGQESNQETESGNGQENVQGRPLLIGGGAGVPPMYGLCRELARRGIQPAVVLGFRSREDAFYEEAFEKMGARVYIATEDGSMGQKGFVTDVIREMLPKTETAKTLSQTGAAETPSSAKTGAGQGQAVSCFFACGPEPMLKAVDGIMPEDIPGQMSFEERMGCGFGACMGCSCQTKYGSKRICKDGPVLERREIVW